MEKGKGGHTMTHAPNMVDGIGDPKNGNVGPTGPKCNPLKLTPPANTREYYNSKIPGVGYHKPKTPSWSPSMEPTDQIQTNTEKPKSYILITHPQTPQDRSEENTTRPTTLTANTAPATESTPCAMHTYISATKRRIMKKCTWNHVVSSKTWPQQPEPTSTMSRSMTS